MSEDAATVLSLEAVKAFRGVCVDYVSNLQKGLNHLIQSTEWVHQGKDGWDDSDYTRIKTRVAKSSLSAPANVTKKATRSPLMSKSVISF